MLPLKDRYRLVLAGGGYANIYLLVKYLKKPIKKLDLTLISESEHQYHSGMASGYIEGIYKEEDISIDLKKICENAGINFIKNRVDRIDVFSKKIWLDSGKSVEFDIVSFNTGSSLLGTDIGGVNDYSIPIKPLSNLRQIKEYFENSLKDGFKIVIAGAGATGVEMAFALKNLSIKLKKKIDIKLVDYNGEIMSGYEEGVKKKITKLLKKRDIGLLLNNEIIEVKKEELIIKGKNRLKFHYLIWTAGPTANKMYKNGKILVDKNGYMIVSRYLQSNSYPYVFGVGDCVSFYDYDYVKKANVYSIKASPVLFKNISLYLKEKNLKKFLPQKNFLSVISIGKGTGIGQYAGMALSGKFIWNLKNKSDCNFMKNIKKLLRKYL